MKCWVCKRQARGFGHTDNRHGVGDPRRYPIDWVFCSQRCQTAFHAMYGNWLRAKDVRVARPLLENTSMTDNNTPTTGIEPMIDAKQAAAALRLPYYWFADHAMRTKYRIPHYLMGGLVRYRLSELSAWATRSTAVQGRDAQDADAPVEGAE